MKIEHFAPSTTQWMLANQNEETNVNITSSRKEVVVSLDLFFCQNSVNIWDEYDSLCSQSVLH